jgi:hypothetical protein
MGDGGYAESLRTAVSIPEDIFLGAERLAPHQGSDATDCSWLDLETEHGGKSDEFVSGAGRRVLERTEW